MQTYRDIVFERILPKVSKPSRYLPEWRVMKKDPDQARLKVALAFPDLYEIGMSHIGLKILYQILNGREGILADRAYAPWEDFRELMLKEEIPLLSHETNLPLKAFDIVGFTLQYELSYTSILDMLFLGGIPLLASDRTEADPLVIAGGPCAFNPEPLVDFIDLFVIGDAEEAIVEIADAVLAWKGAGGKRHELLRALAKIEGNYVPALWDGTTPVQKRTAIKFADVDYARFPVPYMETVHDRPSIEVMRGCLRSCRFCQAGYIYRPLRERSAEDVLEAAVKAVKSTGCEEVSLSSLSISDLSCLSGLLPPLMEALQKERVALSLPSMRVEGITEAFVAEVGKARKGGSFTIAPEAGSKRLRDIINKGWITDEQIFHAVNVAARAGWGSAKMYFMIGQPTEEYEDLDALVKLCSEVLKVGRKEGGRNFSVTASASSFVPKPHTPFQWVGQEPLGVLKERQQYLKRKLREAGVGFKWHQAESSFLEAVFSRGDRRLGKVLLRAHTFGCRFDGWTELLKYDLWMKAFEEEGIDPGSYANRFIPLEEPLPWDHIQVVTKRFLLKEWQRTLKVALTHECQTGPCRACGQVCLPNWRMWAEKVDAFGKGFDVQCSTFNVQEGKRDGPTSNLERRTWNGSPGQRIRFAFQKVGLLRFLSHLELQRVFVRAMKRARIPLAYSQGYHSKPKLAFALALPVGVEGVNELADVGLAEPLAPEEFRGWVNGELPPELQVLKAWEVPLSAPSLTSQVEGAVYQIWLPDPRPPTPDPRPWGEACQRFLEKASIPVQVVRKKQVIEVDARPHIVDFRTLFSGEGLGWELSLRVGKEGSVRPQAVIQPFLEEAFDGGSRPPSFPSGQRLWEGLRIVRTTLLLNSSKISGQFSAVSF